MKIYHPDVVSPSLVQGSPPSGEQCASSSATPSEEHLTPEIVQARFQALTKAYDTLQKGKVKGKARLGGSLFTDATEGKMSARRRRELKARAELRVGDDEKWRERLIVGALFAVSGIVIWLQRYAEPIHRRCQFLCTKRSRHEGKAWLLLLPQGRMERGDHPKTLLQCIPHQKTQPQELGANRQSRTRTDWPHNRRPNFPWTSCTQSYSSSYQTDDGLCIIQYIHLSLRGGQQKSHWREFQHFLRVLHDTPISRDLRVTSSPPTAYQHSRISWVQFGNQMMSAEQIKEAEFRRQTWCGGGVRTFPPTPRWRASTWQSRHWNANPGLGTRPSIGPSIVSRKEKANQL